MSPHETVRPTARGPFAVALALLALVLAGCPEPPRLVVPAEFSGTVRIEGASVAPEGAVFLLARAPDSGGAPLLVRQYSARDFLPAEGGAVELSFHLDERNSMTGRSVELPPIVQIEAQYRPSGTVDATEQAVRAVALARPGDRWIELVLKL